MRMKSGKDTNKPEKQKIELRRATLYHVEQKNTCMWTAIFWEPQKSENMMLMKSCTNPLSWVEAHWKLMYNLMWHLQPLPFNGHGEGLFAFAYAELHWWDDLWIWRIHIAECIWEKVQKITKYKYWQKYVNMHIFQPNLHFCKQKSIKWESIELKHICMNVWKYQLLQPVADVLKWLENIVKIYQHL